MRAGSGVSAQASIELLAALPALALAAALALQLLLVGYSLTIADGAAEAGALAGSSGHDEQRAARKALPGWARDRSRVSTEGGRVRVQLRPPAPLAAVADALTVSSEAWSRPPAAESSLIPVILAAGTVRGPSLGLAAAVAVEAAVVTGAGTLLVEVGDAARRRAPTLLAVPGARGIEGALRAAGQRASARGHLCHLSVPGGTDPIEDVSDALAASEAELAVIHVPERLWVPALEAEDLAVSGGCLLVSLPGERSLAALAVDEAARRRISVRIATRPPSLFAARRALTGVRPGGRASGSAGRIARRLLGLGRSGGDGGQALPALLGAGLILILAALALAAIGGAATGKGRVQRAADLAALSAVRSMRDDVPRLLAPPRLSDGGPNPRHLSKADYLFRARLAAIDAARRNSVDPGRLRLSFPDATADPPLRARVTVTGEIDPDELTGGERAGVRQPIRVVASAVAEASAPVSSWTGMPTQAEGGGYSGPLVYRDGEGMRPDVAAAYDRMAVAARRAGIDLVVLSGFRSDAEQAELFARHPDPRWVAPPGHSLHRCATELDLGPRAPTDGSPRTPAASASSGGIPELTNYAQARGSCEAAD